MGSALLKELYLSRTNPFLKQVYSLNKLHTAMECHCKWYPGDWNYHLLPDHNYRLLHRFCDTRERYYIRRWTDLCTNRRQLQHLIAPWHVRGEGECSRIQNIYREYHGSMISYDWAHKSFPWEDQHIDQHFKQRIPAHWRDRCCRPSIDSRTTGWSWSRNEIEEEEIVTLPNEHLG